MEISNKSLLQRGIGDAVRRARKQKNVRQRELANDVHCSRATLVNIEHGKQQPTIELLFRIARYLKCPYKDLLPTEEDLEKLKTDISEPVMTDKKEDEIFSQLRDKVKEKEARSL